MAGDRVQDVIQKRQLAAQEAQRKVDELRAQEQKRREAQVGQTCLRQAANTLGLHLHWHALGQPKEQQPANHVDDVPLIPTKEKSALRARRCPILNQLQKTVSQICNSVSRNETCYLQ